MAMVKKAKTTGTKAGNKPFYVRIRRKRYRVESKRWPGKTRPKQVGDCDHPEKPNRTIRLDDTLDFYSMLTICLHESLHAGHWDLDEAAVYEITDGQVALLHGVMNKWKTALTHGDGG